MTESLITISLVGLIVGFIFSMPIAGPISILITSNALKGRLRYCHRATIGASFADFVFVFIAVFGITKLYSLYKPFIPYILLLGAVFLLYVGYKIYKTVVDLEHLDEKSHLAEKIKEHNKGGFRTGFMISFLNPTLFLSWMTSSFFIITMVASWGFNTGGLEKNVTANYETISKIEKDTLKAPSIISKLDSLKFNQHKTEEPQLEQAPSYFPLLLSLCYAFFLALGSIIWFYYLALFLAKFRQRINVNIINRIIHLLGFILCLFGLFLGYKAIVLLS
jgi:L-lysine exporter family protein LysE/ArgO